MFQEPETEEIRTSMSLADAADAIRPLAPGAKVIEMKRCAVFDLQDGDRPWAVVSVFEDSPTLVEARYLAGTADPRCARLQAALRRVFSGSTVELTPPAPPTWRERLLDSLRGQRESGIRIRRLAFGPPASPALIERIEREHLGFPMPAAMRAFFEAHDGVSLWFHRVADPAAVVFDHSVPLAIESEAPMKWSEAMHDGGPIWSAIEAADFGRTDDGFFYVGMICIPGLEEMFGTDWGSILSWPKDTVLFDSFHWFRGSALIVDGETKTVYIQPTSDYGAARDAAFVDLGEYLDTLAKSAGTDRVVNGRYEAVHSRG